VPVDDVALANAPQLLLLLLVVVVLLLLLLTMQQEDTAVGCILHTGSAHGSNRHKADQQFGWQCSGCSGNNASVCSACSTNKLLQVHFPHHCHCTPCLKLPRHCNVSCNKHIIKKSTNNTK
jgi:hypothetical protein